MSARSVRRLTDESPRVLAIVVTYFPKVEYLLPLLDRLLDQCEEVLVVDNTPAEDDVLFDAARPILARVDNCRIVRLGKNAGIAAALNVGSNVGIAEKFDYVLHSDQDSLPAANMVARLVEVERTVAASGRLVGAVGPLIRDLVTGIDYPFQVPVPGKLFYGHRLPSAEEPNVTSSSIVTSGMLIPVKSLSAIGAMIDELFIDHVDVEWCHRARANGYEIIGTGNAVLCHRMGEQSMRVWYFGWQAMSEYGPVRLYYRYRNFVYLLKLSYIPLSWKLRASWYWLGNLYGHAIYSHRRLDSLQAAALGLWDGILGRYGPCSRCW